MATDEEKKKSIENNKELDKEQNASIAIISKLLSTEEHRKIKNRLIEDCNYIRE